MAEGGQPRPVQDGEQEYAFRSVELYKTETLGTGSYGAVCKAKCDELICAAKLLYPVLFEMQPQAPEPGKEHRQPFHRFELECRFLSHINHPNIVQYLGTYRDPDTNAPVLLMELMDESLTHFLESSPGPIPYHVQVNLCYDIAQALAFLHSNGIIHRDLSSNNVLLIAGSRAKVTDFGMSKFTNIASTRLATMTTCPGTPVFMSPEALNEPPVYTEKLDNFSLGVLIVQIVTRKLPNPTDRFQVMQVVDPRFPTRTFQAQVPVPEAERRHAHISLVDPTHPLLPIALHCLKDEDVERPSSQQLCQTLGALKETAMYEESSQDEDYHPGAKELLQGPDKELNLSQAETQRLIEQLMRATRDNEAKEGQLRRLNQQVESNEEITTALQHTITEKEREVSELQRMLTSKDDDISSRREPVFHEQRATLQDIPTKANLERAPLPDSLIGMKAGSSTVDGNMAYFRPAGSRTVYGFKVQSMQWCLMPEHPLNGFTIVCVDHLLTSVGGKRDGFLGEYCTDDVFSLIDRKWVKHFPPMPMKRITPTALYTNNALVVAGGRYSATIYCVKVAVLNTQTKQWSSVSSLPFSMAQASSAVCGDHIYFTAGYAAPVQEKCAVLTCSLKALVQSKRESKLWKKITSLPVHSSSLASVNGRLLAVGGKDSSDGLNKDIFEFDPAANSWNFVGQTTVAGTSCLTAVLPGNRLMVVGQNDFEIVNV